MHNDKDPNDDDLQSDDEDWRCPVDDIVSQSVKSSTVTKRAPPHYVYTALHPRGDNLLVSKLGHQRTIIHIDIDCFYAQVEMIRDPELRSKPLGIQQKYLLVTCNYVARTRGVTKLMGIKEAKEKCPDLVLVCGEDLTHYREMSYKISEFLQKYTPNVERLGFDENYIDVSEMVEQRISLKDYTDSVNGFVYGAEGSPHMAGGSSSCPCGCHVRLAVGSQIAADIREALHLELGITCCAGIAHNKLLSKLVAGAHKPNQQTTLFPGNAAKLLHSLTKAREIPGIGWTTSKKLSAAGIHSVADVQQCDMTVLTDECGAAMAATVKQLSHGIDDSPVVPYSLPQTISDEDSFKKCTSVSQAQEKVEELLSSLLKRLIEDGRTPHTFRLTLRRLGSAKYTNRESKQCPIPAQIFNRIGKGDISTAHEQLTKIAMSLFEKLVNVKQPFHLTLINVAFAKLEQKSSSDISSFFLPQKVSQGISDDSDSRDHENIYRKSSPGVTMGINSRPDGDSRDLTLEVNNQNKPEKMKLEDRSPSESPGCRIERSSEATSSTEKSFMSFFIKKGIAKHSENVDHENSQSANECVFDNTVNAGNSECSNMEGITDSYFKKGTSSCVEQDNHPEEHHCASEVNLELPGGIDPNVFGQLPPEVQNDILGDFRSTRSKVYGLEQKRLKSGRKVKHTKQSTKKRGKTADEVECRMKEHLNAQDTSPCGRDGQRIVCDSQTGTEIPKQQNDYHQNTIITQDVSTTDTSPFKKKKRLFSPGKPKKKETLDSDTNNNEPPRSHCGNSEKQTQADLSICQQKEFKDDVGKTTFDNMSTCRLPHLTSKLHEDVTLESVESDKCDNTVTENLTHSPSLEHVPSVSVDMPSTSSFELNIPSSSLDLDTNPEPQFRCMTGPPPAVPPDMDEDVFRSLPVEIQAELSLQWQFQNIRKNTSTLNRMSEQKKKSPKVSRKKSSSNNPTLLKFFRNKTK